MIPKNAYNRIAKQLDQAGENSRQWEESSFDIVKASRRRMFIMSACRVVGALLLTFAILLLQMPRFFPWDQRWLDAMVVISFIIMLIPQILIRWQKP
ncbi:hypothetical protein [Zymomonas mobilis]|uniref:Uncharacterized protein n=1 Tax=Zymomonas mobilis subsp. mobilis (strain ATCC 10988 / DSM 424 / LMG 404 / NCIMB 8938 / NRRL B-806 / ZM1) TaxID=555217 RepID=A0A0H3FYN7_ZYMMA|nr:hypothetical protein [Zymomonas mobilis]AEH62809.1 conserved hypothetical protein [Zymomonas mobilis subsp. mobilis ATCC 10988]AHB10139.1 hypothetical protein ZCP4_0837 [Zymomonas mobilis subsp. mobilis str. CP4 = NRRL B-14023]AHJ70446.1 hypothetical protein A254_00827 [Zymomonas mobilis subsp. mobilis NRRL B-12526]AHJ72301.1 hypothetical protein A265_00827 [Zymomonas mobilis subsp. mobilis str. CP4 = NRRL B-14023]ART93295.1 hypothetical protein B9T50_03715 [Zymomonas mobilis subsp. mobilis